MRKFLAWLAIVALTCAPALAEEIPSQQPSSTSDSAPKPVDQDRLKMSDLAVMAAIVALSLAAYKAKGKPCACPSDTMSNGRACGSNSAYMRPSGAKPLCFPTDVSTEMIKAWRATGSVLSLDFHPSRR